MSVFSSKWDSCSRTSDVLNKASVSGRRFLTSRKVKNVSADEPPPEWTAEVEAAMAELERAGAEAVIRALENE
jgi:hypothetical protein